MSRPYLLDVNVLIALAWPSHVHHAEAQAWFGRRRKVGFRTCPLTQLGFVRISSNPGFSPQAVSPKEAEDLLSRITALPEHGFWPDDLPYANALGQPPGKIARTVAGHRQVTDAYLIGLAAAHGGVLATLDRAASALSGPVELVGPS